MFLSPLSLRSWRSVDIFCQPITEEEDEREVGAGEPRSAQNRITVPLICRCVPQVEDLSDAAFIQHHQPYEDQERTRWTWRALAPAKRRGSRSDAEQRRAPAPTRLPLTPPVSPRRSYKSVDGRTTPLLCGTNPPTPQPASPDPGPCPPLHDYSHVASPLSPASPDTPCSRDSQRLLSSEDTRCSTPDFSFEERVRRLRPFTSLSVSPLTPCPFRRWRPGSAAASRCPRTRSPRPRASRPGPECAASRGAEPSRGWTRTRRRRRARTRRAPSGERLRPPALRSRS